MNMKKVSQQNKVQPYKCLDVGRRQSRAAVKPPSAASLFDPKFERAACGVGFIVNINGTASRKVSLSPSLSRCAVEWLSMTGLHI